MNEVVPVSVIAKAQSCTPNDVFVVRERTSPVLVRVAANGTHKEVASISRQRKHQPELRLHRYAECQRLPGRRTTAYRRDRACFDNNVNHGRSLFESLTLPNGTNVPVVITIDSTRLFPRED